MIEAIRNRLNVDSPTHLRWPIVTAVNSPYPIKLPIENLFGLNPGYLPSAPLLCLGNELITFQIIAKWTNTLFQVPIRVHFETSLNGVNWDKIPGSEFSPDLDSATFGVDDHSLMWSETFEVLVCSKYIRCCLMYADEAYDNTATVEILCTQKEA